MKDFFKPSKAKIIITLLLPLYVGIVGIVTMNASGESSIVSSFVLNYLPFVAVTLTMMYSWAANENFFDNFSLASGGEKVLYFMTEIVLPLAINYLLACLIIFLYRKFRALEQVEKKSTEVPASK